MKECKKQHVEILLSGWEGNDGKFYEKFSRKI